MRRPSRTLRTTTASRFLRGDWACCSSATAACWPPITAATTCCLRAGSTVFKRRPRTIPDSIGHWKEWIEACKTGSPTTCNFDYSGALTETVLLGIVAFRCGTRLEWDAANLKAHLPQAEAYIKKAYRKGFEIAGIS